MDKDAGFTCKNVNQKDKQCHDYRVRFSCYAPYCADEVCWTDWFDRDNPSGTGDWETLSSLQKQYPEKICKKPKYIEVVTVGGDVPATATGQDFYIFNPTEGFVCKNAPGQDCKDYKVRSAAAATEDHRRDAKRPDSLQWCDVCIVLAKLEKK